MKQRSATVREAIPDTVILFGSRARGDARPDSDVDLLIVEPEPFSPQRSRRQETARLYLALRRLAMRKDLLLYGRDEFERLKGSAHPVVGRALWEGKGLVSVGVITRGTGGGSSRPWRKTRGLGNHFMLARSSTSAWSKASTRIRPRRGYSMSMMT
ncbi:MAG: nucleotidyltransferase domain-containing protein [Candidatus Accumulibacter sp.]|jgi:predicted nucleotidyltransferase|nr:nucleotidyltransferase domain-containing protein [Candidatus Accumulibacter necessarius]